jgi:uncharacterized protein (DUF2147 family)
MKRFGCLVVLMVLSSSAHAGGYSFVVGGHRIYIEAPRGCSSPSCAAISIPGIYESRRSRERSDDVDAAAAPAPVKQAPQLASAPPVTPPTAPPAAAPAAAPPSPPAAAVPAPASAPKEAAAPTPPPAPLPPPAAPASIVVAPAAPAAVVKASREPEEVRADSPLGDWRTDGNKGMVRIETCGKALCGYVLNPKSDAIGEAVLINMKPKGADVWSGNIYSRASGATYYATMAMKGANSLRVEACVLGRFFCSGNLWSRIAAKPQELITSRQPAPEPKS